ncbi:unnamed protein product [Orchesella dallaii]|uniref:Uncharacterized protein n=1 Tax=Orchesella dallaii TaxID=48710 RepID=A0ABP1SB73_9HEXA
MYIELVMLGFCLHKKLFSKLFPSPINWDSERERFYLENNARALRPWNFCFHLCEFVLSNLAGLLILVKKFYVGDEYIEMLDVVLLFVGTIGMIPSLCVNTVIRRHGSDIVHAMNALFHFIPLHSEKSSREIKRQKIVRVWYSRIKNVSLFKMLNSLNNLWRELLPIADSEIWVEYAKINFVLSMGHQGYFLYFVLVCLNKDQMFHLLRFSCPQLLFNSNLIINGLLYAFRFLLGHYAIMNAMRTISLMLILPHAAFQLYVSNFQYLHRELGGTGGIGGGRSVVRRSLTRYNYLAIIHAHLASPITCSVVALLIMLYSSVEAYETSKKIVKLWRITTKKNGGFVGKHPWLEKDPHVWASVKRDRVVSASVKWDHVVSDCVVWDHVVWDCVVRELDSNVWVSVKRDRVVSDCVVRESHHNVSASVKRDRVVSDCVVRESHHNVSASVKRDRVDSDCYQTKRTVQFLLRSC